MRKRKVYAKTDLTYLSRFMSGLFPDQQRLSEIQAVYDNLTLLGQLLGAGTDITSMREDFHGLASVLLDQLAREHHKKATLNLSSCARVAIDILTRNLFERTADIGFLATDSQICAFAEAVENDPETRHDPAWQYKLHTHFTEYVAKYSVYHNIILLSPQGEVLAQLDGNNPVTQTADPLLGDALNTSDPYVEIFRTIDLLPGEASPLIYAYRVMSADGSHPVGVLCLCFRFQDECQRIFSSLVTENDWTVVTLLDAGGRVIATSDPYQFPVGALVAPIADDACQIMRFAGREYLATTRSAQGYQGYNGPGWLGHVLAPLNHAFAMTGAHELEAVPDDFLKCVLETATLFNQELRDIPVKAANIQQELNRAVWNGNIWLAQESAAHNADFAKVLLREIGSTGVRTRNVFSESTTNLYKTVLSSVLFDCSTQAALAIDIMDRNLYERANDCRWWALTRVFREELGKTNIADREQRQRLTDVLRTINSLYTVYTNLLLFDQSGRIVSVSNPSYNDMIGKSISDNWVRNCLGLKDSQSYAVSGFSPSELYAGQSTYIYSAAVREPGTDEPVGGIAIVFDATLQLQAMLMDTLPRQADGELLPGTFAVFAERNGQVIASTEPELAVGSKLFIGAEFFNLQRGESFANVVIYNGAYYAVGSCMNSGYREYKSANDARQNDVVALIFWPLSERVIDAENLHSLRDIAVDRYLLRQSARERDTVDIASFYIGSNWYGIRPSDVVAAIDADRLTPMPGVAEWVHGCLMYDDQAITVFDLASTLSPVRLGQDRRKPRGDEGLKRQILVLKSPSQQVRFGLLVDNLGDIAEIPAARIEAVPDMISDGNTLIESLVKPQGENGERRILIVLSVEKILGRFAVNAPIRDYLADRIGSKP